ncbi:MAG: PLP-dependent aminotransferase family protein [Deltaproteobacteria bacterium]|nr:PLP-dependent aminotransferase family protein [Deltaproteobacteria bacterium]
MAEIQTAQLNLPPDVIEFGAGQPSPRLLPLKLLREAAANRLGNDDASYLAYGAEQGDGFFRLELANFLSDHYQIRVESDNLFITGGASQGLDLICTLLSRPGDTIFVEEPSYFLALRIFADHGLNIVSLPMDDRGLIIEALEQKLSLHTPAFLYTIPTFHNPSSVTLAADRRNRLVQLSRQHNLVIVADEVYHLLNYAAAAPPPLASHIESIPVISLGSFSKIMAPGLRLGWIQAGAKLMNRLSGCGLVDSGGGLNPFTSGVMRSAIELGLLEKQLTDLKAVYKKRKIALSKVLMDLLPTSVRFNEPDGGFFIWLEFDDDIDAAQMLPAARKSKVGFLPGVRFSSQKGLKNYARLSFAYYDVPELEEGAKLLAKVVREFRV